YVKSFAWIEAPEAASSQYVRTPQASPIPHAHAARSARLEGASPANAASSGVLSLACSDRRLTTYSAHPCGGPALRIACGARSPCARGVALLTYHHHRVISTSPPSREQPRAPAWLAPGFFLSGAAALIYQVVWQRVLFASFGINVEAVTVVVTAFLLGLGIGSVVGRELARSPTRPPC